VDTVTEEAGTMSADPGTDPDDAMKQEKRKMGHASLGEFEQMVLLSILQQGDEAFGLEVRREIERSADRDVSRSAFYTTLDRLEQKGFVRWEEAMPEAPLRRFEVTEEGRAELAAGGRAWRSLWKGLEGLMEEA